MTVHEAESRGGQWPSRPAAGGARHAHHGGMRARACVGTELRTTPVGQRTSVSTLRSAAPLVLRPTAAKEAEPWVVHVEDAARVSVAAGAAGPVGGDEFVLHVDVGPGTCLVLCEVSPTLLLPGPHGGRSRTRVRIRVGAAATLVWLPEPLIAARGCNHVNDVRVDLEDDSRLFMREEVLLGRHGEEPGVVVNRVAVRRGGRPLYRQDLDFGTPMAGSPAVVGGHRAVGSALIVDPDRLDSPLESQRLGLDAALLPLSGPAVLITALAGDNLRLRDRLHAGLRALGRPWDPSEDRDVRHQAGTTNRGGSGAERAHS